jgi:erythromycin esterase-like protein
MRTINKSKGKHSLVEWLRWKSNGRTVTNAKFYGIDMDKSKKLRESTLRFLTSEIESALKN